MIAEAKHKCPFKFLDPYGIEDYNFFFGREKEVRELYEHVNKNRIVLVYGQSGTGKTSIIKCGLANTFEPSDWLPFFVRRNSNINDSLQEVVGNKYRPTAEELAAIKSDLFSFEGQKQIGLINTPEKIRADYQDYVANLLYNIKKHSQHSLRPVYIIFDQFEELLILGSHEERDLFIFTLKYLARPNIVTSCHVIIVMREEYFGWLDFVEKEIPEVADRRLRVEAMRVNELREVIEKSCKKFNIEFSNPSENITQIVKALSRRGEISLPYLQVYLDQLWREDYHRTYSDKPAPDTKYAPLVFTTEEIRKFGEIKDVLQRFLIERKAIIQKDVKKNFPHVDDDFVNSVLDCFVNDQGTKQPFQYEVVDGIYRIKGGDYRLFKGFDQKALSFTLDALEENQILRNNANYFELGHDILAKLIDGQRDSRQKRINGIRIMINIYKKQNELIPYSLIKSWEKDMDKLILMRDEQNFYERSKQEGYRKETHDYLNKAVKRAMEKRKYKLISVLLGFTLAILGMVGFFFWKNLKRENGYYAVDAITNLDTINNKQDALVLGRYFYDYKFKLLDSVKSNIIQNRFLQIARSESLTKSFSIANLTLKSSAGLLQGFDVDLSYNGKYLSIRNDAQGRVNEPGDFMLLNTATNTVVNTFTNVLYSYFLGSTDTLLLAVLDTTRLTEDNLPNGFILYDCRHNEPVTGIWMNDSKDDRNFLYDKNYLSANVFSFWDSFKVRFDKSGKLIIPYFTYRNKAQGVGSKNKIPKLDIRSIHNKVLYSTISEYTVSLSKQGDKAIYAYPGKQGQLVFAEYSDYRGYNNVLFSGAEFADYTENDYVVYRDNYMLRIADQRGNVIRTARVDKLFTYAYAGNDNNYAVLACQDSSGVVSFSRNTVKTFNGRLVGYNFDARRLVTMIPEDEGKSGNKLVLWDFKGDSLKSFSAVPGIESVTFNVMGNSILAKCIKGENVNYQFLYVLDGNLDVTATLFLTPNDTYGFSGNGRYYYYVRDNSACVFKNTYSINATNINTIYDWLNIQRNISGDNYRKNVDSLLGKYRISRFRTERFKF